MNPSSFRAALESVPEQLEVPLPVVGRLAVGEARLILGGMGGSAAAGDFLALFSGLARPLRSVREASLPADAAAGDVLLALSYSGDTAECLDLWREAERRGLARAAVTAGGTLLEWARREGDPHVVLPRGYAPRTALGHLLRGAAALAGIDGADWTQAATHLREVRRAAGEADGLAARILGHFADADPVLVSGDGVAHAAARRWAAVFGENAKICAVHWALPEAAHNLVMAVDRVAPRRGRLALLALGEPPEGPARRHWEAVLKAMAAHGTEALRVDLPHPEPWIHALGLAYLGDWVSFHLAERLGVDPAPIGLMDDVKERLASGKDPAS